MLTLVAYLLLIKLHILPLLLLLLLQLEVVPIDTTLSLVSCVAPFLLERHPCHVAFLSYLDINNNKD